MKHLLLFFLLLICASIGRGQGSMELSDRPFICNIPTDSSLLKWLQKSPEYRRYSEEQQQMVYWINFLRTRPKDFLNQVYLPFLVQFPEAACPEASSLTRELKEKRPLSSLTPTQNLTIAASKQANWVAAVERLMHTGPGGTTFEDRMIEAGVKECASENILMGRPDILVALILLLIDKDVPGTGHRKNLLTPEFKWMGIAVIPYLHDQTVVDQVFSCDL